MNNPELPNLSDLTQEDINILKQELNVKEVELRVPLADGRTMIVRL